MPGSVAWHKNSSTVRILGAGLEAAVFGLGNWGYPGFWMLWGTWGSGAHLICEIVCNGAGICTEVSHRVSSPLSSQRVSFSVLGFVEK